MIWKDVRHELPDQNSEVLIINKVGELLLGEFFGEIFYCNNRVVLVNNVTHFIPVDQIPRPMRINEN